MSRENYINIAPTFNIKQKAFIDNDKNYFCGMCGGYGSGKTYALCWKIFKYCLQYPNDRHLFLCLDYNKARRVAIPILIYKILIPHNIKYELNKSELILRTEFNKNESGIFFKSATNPDSLVSYEYRTAAVDEPSLMDEDIFAKLPARIRGIGFHQINFAFTWDKVPFHWTYKNFWENPVKDLALYRAPTILNVENVGMAYIETLSNIYNPDMIKNYLEGFPINLKQNLIYWAFNREKHVSKNCIYSKLLPIGVTFDFNKNPMTITIVQWTKTDSYAIDEIIDFNSNTEKATEKLMSKLNEIDCDRRGDVYIFGDPAGAYGHTESNFTNYQIIEKILKRKYRPLKDIHYGAISLEGRYVWINRLLTGAEGINIHINPKCNNLIQDYESMSYKEDSKNIPDKTDPKRSHSSDNHDYYLYQRFPVSGGKIFG